MVERYRIGLTQLKAIPSPFRGRVRVGVKSHASNIVPNCVTPNQKRLARFGVVAALALAVLALAACGSAAQPTDEAPVATAEPATAPAATPGGGSGSTGAADPEPQGDIAPKFTLPSAAGDSVSLDSFAGDRNVVLVFYRGFW